MAQSEVLSLVKEGIVAARAGKRDEARRRLREATEIDPDHESAWLWLASVSESPGEAVRCFEEVLSINPNHVQARTQVHSARLHAGIAAAKAQDRSGARRHLGKVVEQDADNETAWLWLASVSETPHEAVARLERVLEINPDNDRARAGLDYYRGQIAVAEEPAWACPLCESPQESPHDRCPICKATLGLTRIEAFFDAESADAAAMQTAVDRLGRALQERPTFEAHFHTALAHLNARRVAEAVPHLRSALQMKSGDQSFRNQVRAILQRHAAEEAASRERSAKKKARQVTVLCIDDSPTVRKLVSLTLEAAGHRVLTAADGYEAGEVLRDRGVPDLVLLDIDMPGPDGLQVCRLLRQNEGTRKVPIVMLSGKDGFFIKLRGQMAGSNEYLRKPVLPEQLVGTVAKYCAVKV